MTADPKALRRRTATQLIQTLTRAGGVVLEAQEVLLTPQNTRLSRIVIGIGGSPDEQDLQAVTITIVAAGEQIDPVVP